MTDLFSRPGPFTRTVFACLLLSLFPALPAFGQVQDSPDPFLEIIPWNGFEVIQGECLVRFVPGILEDERIRIHASLGVEWIRSLAAGLDRIRFQNGSLDDWLRKYGALPEVRYAEPNFAYRPSFTPDDPLWAGQWGPKKIRCSDAWNLQKGKSGFVVAVIDSGVDMDHVDLNDHYAWGYDYYSGDAWPNDLDGHGTHVTGIAAAETHNNEGIAGVAFKCRYAAYRTGNQTLVTSAIVAAINDARAKGAHALSMSFEGPYSASIHTAVVNAYDAGMVCVASAGNGGNTAKLYPAALPEVIAVASSESDDTRSAFSTYGSWVDVAAPGSAVNSTFNNGGYKILNGTSMSCAHVSGMAALLYSVVGGPRSKAKADQIRQAIQDSAVPVGSWVKYGRVDLWEAVLWIDPPKDPPVIQSVDPLKVQAFQGGILTLTGEHFATAVEVDCAGVKLTPPGGFTIVSDLAITFPAPPASALGSAQVLVTNLAGTSNPGSFTYIETMPPKLSMPAFTKTGEAFHWSFGAGAHDGYFLNMSSENTTFQFGNYPILYYFTTLSLGHLDPAGIGDFQAKVPPGLQGSTFYSQIIVFEDQNGAFKGASEVKSTLIIG